jgi:hypothetical protein
LTTQDVLPENFTTLEKLWGFWDTHSSADYEDTMEAVEVEIDLSSSGESDEPVNAAPDQRGGLYAEFSQKI